MTASTSLRARDTVMIEVGLNASVDARGCDVLTYPTYLGEFDHIWRLHDEAEPRLAPSDVIQNVGLCSWDEAGATSGSAWATARWPTRTGRTRTWSPRRSG